MRYPSALSSWRFRWYHLAVLILGLAAVVVLVILVLRSGWLSQRIRQAGEDAPEIEDTGD